MTFAEAVQALSAAPATVLCILVWIEQRQIRILIRALELAISAMLERERIEDSKPTQSTYGPMRPPLPQEHPIAVPRVKTFRRLPSTKGDDDGK